MNNCWVPSVPPDSSYETFSQPVLDWVARLTAGLNRSIPNTNQTLGDLERAILQQTQGLERNLLEATSQKKADRSPPVCPGLCQSTEPAHSWARTDLSDSLWAGDDPTQPRLVSALQSVAFSRRLGVKLSVQPRPKSRAPREERCLISTRGELASVLRK